MEKLGCMKRIDDLRSIWPHEEQDFSKWLAQKENLEQLSDAIEIDLELEETESPVGSFSVDIYARESGSSRGIIIENQRIFFLEAESSGDTEKTMDLPDYR